MTAEAYETPGEELLARKCWVPECRNLAAFRDGAGWWWCKLHEDRQMWGVAEYPTYDDVLKRGANLKKAALSGPEVGELLDALSRYAERPFINAIAEKAIANFEKHLTEKS